MEFSVEKHSKFIKLILYFVFICSLFFLLIWSLLDAGISLPDDFNYIAELKSREIFDLSPDFLSWSLLKGFTSIFGYGSYALRLFGLLIFIFTCYILSKRNPYLLFLYLVSIVPFFFNLYFNQFRLLLAFTFFLICYSYGFRRLSILAVGFHTSAIFFIFRPALSLAVVFGIITLLETMSSFEAWSYVALKLDSYSAVNYAPPIYFGWEIVLLSLCLFLSKKSREAAQLIFCFVLLRLIAVDFNVIIARRILELVILYYSPVCLYLRDGIIPPHILIYLFSVLCIFTYVPLIL